MKNQHDIDNIRLASSEIGQLWLTYIGDTMTKCVVSYFEQIVEDTGIKKVVKFLSDKVDKQIETAKDIFNSVNFPIPQGFGEIDVNLKADRLFSDILILYYIKFAAKFALINQGVALSVSSREDVYKFFDEYIDSYKELCKRTDKVLMEKGLYIRFPHISIPEKIEFVNNKKYLSGFVQDLMGKERPINVLEIQNAFEGIMTNSMGKALLMGFIQVIENKELQKYFKRGKEIAEKHIEVLSTLLKEEDVPVPMGWDTEVITSADPPFSEKLMLFHITTLISYQMGKYGIDLVNSPRSDIYTTYSRFIAEIAQYSRDGAILLINNGWLEEIPSKARQNG